MRLLLLSKSVNNGRSYRGTDRVSVFALYSTSDRNYLGIRRVWDEHQERFGKAEPGPEEIEDTRRLGWSPSVVRDIAEARWLVEAFRNYAGLDFEIIEITKGRAEPTIGGKFLGYDLSASYDESFLKYGLEERPLEIHDDHIPGDPYKKPLAHAVLVLTEKYFGPRLNANGLFDDYNEAAFCLKCMVAIPFISPESYEQEDTEGESAYEVLGLYDVTQI